MHDLWVASPARYPHKQPLLHLSAPPSHTFADAIAARELASDHSDGRCHHRTGRYVPRQHVSIDESVLPNAVGRRVDPRDPIVGESGAQVGPIVRNRNVDSGTLVETDNDGRVMR